MAILRLHSSEKTHFWYHKHFLIKLFFKVFCNCFRALHLFHLQSVVEHLLQTHCRSTSLIKMMKGIQFTWSMCFDYFSFLCNFTSHLGSKRDLALAFKMSKVHHSQKCLISTIHLMGVTHSLFRAGLRLCLAAPSGGRGTASGSIHRWGGPSASFL